VSVKNRVAGAVRKPQVFSVQSGRVPKHLGKFWTAETGQGAPPASEEIGDRIQLTLPVAQALSNAFITAEGILLGVQGADTLITSVLIQAGQAGWWRFRASIINGNGGGINNRDVRILKGIPVLGSLLTVGSLLHYNFRYVVGDSINGPASWFYDDGEPIYCPTGTLWELRIGGAMVAGDNIVGSANAMRYFVP
jgi:hypothetical protein